jgi:CDP-diacylglycerol--serine O-phosphatidyltransferase
LYKPKKFTLGKKPVSILKLIPNIVTILGLCIGFSAIRFALDSKWELAVLFIIIAAVIDGIDGTIAKILNATSSFGAELDSLCDFVNFGITPVLITYLWIFNDYSIKVISWGAVLLFSVCTVLRLARFNTLASSASEDKALSKFIIGVPSPAGAMLALFPIAFEFHLSEYTGFSFHSHPFIIAFYQSIVGILMASRLPTYYLKNISVQPHNLWFTFIILGIIVISVFLYPWISLPFIGLVYVCSFPFSYISWKKLIAQTSSNNLS